MQHPPTATRVPHKESQPIHPTQQLSGSALSGLIGLTGPGPLSRSQLQARDAAFVLTYDRFSHIHADTELVVDLPSERDRDGIAVAIDQGFLDDMRLTSSEPEAVAQRVTSSGVTYDFPPGNAEDVGAKEIRIVFRFQPKAIGPVHGKIYVGPFALEFDQLVYP